MADSGFVVAGQGRDVANIGTVAWTNPGNITADDATNASASLAPGVSSHSLVGDTFSLSSIPDSATIDGIEVKVQFAAGATADPNSQKLSNINIAKSDAVVATPKSDQILTATMGDYSFGGPTDKWGLAWTVAEIKATTFQVRANGRNDSVFSTSAFTSDVYQVKIYYHVNTFFIPPPSVVC